MTPKKLKYKAEMKKHPQFFSPMDIVTLQKLTYIYFTMVTVGEIFRIKILFFI